METKYSSSRPNRSWWSRRSRRTKLLLIAIVVGIIVIALGLGLGLGLGLMSRDDGKGTAKDNSNITEATLPPTPTDKQIWQPEVNATWQIVLSKTVVLNSSATIVIPDVDVYDLDMFLTPNETIAKLHSLGKKVICYFSAGSYEPDRPDSKDFKADDMGKWLSGWPGEKWLNLNSKNVRDIMARRVTLAKSKGCDGIDPDNTDAYDNNNGLGMTANDSINFIGFLASKAQENSIAIGLKNSGTIVSYTLPAMQWQVNEQCVQHDECTSFKPFIDNSKPVFHIEYIDQVKKDFVPNFCKSNGHAEGAARFSTVLKKTKLDGWVEYCNGMITTTPT